MEGSKTLFCSSKFQWARERISSKITDKLGTCPQNVSQALAERVPLSGPHNLQT